MKNLIMGIAMTLLLALFLSFQTDIQGMQVQGVRLKQTANEAARAAALQNDLNSFIEGLITFTDDGAFVGDQVVKANLSMTAEGVSGDKYYKDKPIDSYIIMFNQAFTAEEMEILRDVYEIPESVLLKLGKYTVYKNGAKIADNMPFNLGDRAAVHVNNYITLPRDFDPVIQYPSVVCVIDTGEPNFKNKIFSEGATLRKAGIYEYVW